MLPGADVVVVVVVVVAADGEEVARHQEVYQAARRMHVFFVDPSECLWR